MFRVTLAKTRTVRGELHYDVRVSAMRSGGWHVCGLFVFNPREWDWFRSIVDANPALLEITHEGLPTETAEDTTPR